MTFFLQRLINTLKTLRFQLILAMALMFLIASESLLFFQSYSQLQTSLQDKREDAIIVAGELSLSFSKFIDNGDKIGLDKANLVTMWRHKLLSIIILDTEFELITKQETFLTRREQKTNPEMATKRSEAISALIEQFQKGETMPEYLANDRFYIGKIISLSDTTKAHVLVEFTEKSLWGRWLSDFSELSNKMIGFVIAMIVLMFAFAQWATSGLRHMQKVTSKIADGDFTARIKPIHHREVSVLAENFNHMVLAMDNQFKAINKLALEDKVTGLPNRIFFQRQLKSAIASAKRYDRVAALLFIDLDGFKAVNDTLGHDAGDLLLKQVAQRISQCVRESDIVARDLPQASSETEGPSTSRIGGDEFTLILPEINSAADAGIVAKRVLAALSEEFDIDGNKASIGASIGISCYPDDAEDETSILKNADIAMYAAKRAGKNTSVFYRQDLNKSSERNLILSNDYKRDLEIGRIQAHFKPTVLFDGGLVALEGLLYWDHKKFGLLAATEFREVTSQIQRVREMTSRHIEDVCHLISDIKSTGGPVPYFSVRVPKSALQDSNFATEYQAILAQFDIQPDLLRIRLSQGVLISDERMVSENLEILKQIGTTIVLDDFTRLGGSLELFSRLPIGRIKISCKQGNSEAAIKSALAISNQMNFTASAIDVDNPETYERAVGYGFTNGAGNYLAPIMDQAQTLRWYMNNFVVGKKVETNGLRVVK